MERPSLADEPLDLPPVLVAERLERRCEWCGRSLSTDTESLSLSADVGRRVHRYLPRQYHACDETCRAQTTRFVRRHLRLGPVVWLLTLLAFLAGVVTLAAILPPPFRLLTLGLDDLIPLLLAIGAAALGAGVLVAIFPYPFVARRPEGDPPVVPLRRARQINRGLGVTMAIFALVILLRAGVGA